MRKKTNDPTKSRAAAPNMPRSEETMFENVEELKEFIVWAKEQQISRVRVKDIEFEVSNIGIIQSSPEFESQMEKAFPASKASNTNQETSILSAEELMKKEEEELLYWSSNN